MNARYGAMKPVTSLVLGAMMGLATLSGCLRIPDGVGVDKLGSIEVKVTDQCNAPVENAEVVILQKSGSTTVQLQSKATSAAGEARFDAVQQATLQMWALPPDGYTGGGETASKPVTVVAGDLVEATYQLTKTGAVCPP